MTKGLYTIKPYSEIGQLEYEPASPEQIAEAAGVAELRQQLEALTITCEGLTLYVTATNKKYDELEKQRDALLAAAKLMTREDGGNVLVGAIFDTEFRTHGRLTMELVALKDALQAAIALCDKAATGGGE
jgi:hypothetical protein